MINKLYGMNDGIINLVKNELSRSELVNEEGIFKKVTVVFPNEDVSITDVSDLIHHLK